MLAIFFLLIFFGLALVLTAMLGAYRGLSVGYVRSWARKGDVQAKALYPLLARGQAVPVTMELLRALLLSAAFVLMARTFWPVAAWLIMAVFFFGGSVILGEVYLKQFGTKLLVWCSAALLVLVDVFKPLTVPLGSWLDSYKASEPTSLTKIDVAKVLSHPDSMYTDLSHDELRILKHALSFGDKTVHDVMTPRSVVVGAKSDDTLSPVLLDELHQSGHSRFPVFSDDGHEVIGILFVRDLAAAKGHAKVSEVMHTKAYYVNENRELDHVLQAFLRTKQHMFIVVNAFAEITGVVTIEDIVEQILGKPIIDEFDKYEDMRAVAEAQAKKTAKKREAQEV